MMRLAGAVAVLVAMALAPAATAAPLTLQAHECTTYTDGGHQGYLIEEQCNSEVTVRRTTLLTEDCWDYTLEFYGSREHYWRCRRTVGPVADRCHGSESSSFPPSRYCATNLEAGRAELTCIWANGHSRCELRQGATTHTICEDDCPRRPMKDPVPYT